MENFIKNFVGTGSSSSSSRIHEQLKQIQENTQRYGNRLSVSIEDWEQYIKNWEMPKQNIKELYKVGNFEFKRDSKGKIQNPSYRCYPGSNQTLNQVRVRQTHMYIS